jgi:hypothetical protein
MWVKVEGDEILFSTLKNRQKAANLTRDPRVSIQVSRLWAGRSSGLTSQHPDSAGGAGEPQEGPQVSRLWAGRPSGLTSQLSTMISLLDRGVDDPDATGAI